MQCARPRESPSSPEGPKATASCLERSLSIIRTPARKKNNQMKPAFLRLDAYCSIARQAAPIQIRRRRTKRPSGNAETHHETRRIARRDDQEYYSLIQMRQSRLDNRVSKSEPRFHARNDAAAKTAGDQDDPYDMSDTERHKGQGKKENEGRGRVNTPSHGDGLKQKSGICRQREVDCPLECTIG